MDRQVSLSSRHKISYFEGLQKFLLSIRHHNTRSTKSLISKPTLGTTLRHFRSVLVITSHLHKIHINVILPFFYGRALFCVCGGVLLCGCFGNMCTCIYCVLYCVYCVFVLFRLCIFIICFVCTNVRTTATE